MRAFVSSWAERLPLRINALSRSRSSPVSLTTYFLTAISFPATNHLHRWRRQRFQKSPSFSMTGTTSISDLTAAAASRKPISEGRWSLTHVAYAAIYENASDLVSGWSNADQIAVNNSMLHNVIEPLISRKPVLKHVSVLQGTKAYGVHIPLRSRPARAIRATSMLTFSSTSRTMFATWGRGTVLPTRRCGLSSSPERPPEPERSPGHRGVRRDPPGEG